MLPLYWNCMWNVSQPLLSGAALSGLMFSLFSRLFSALVLLSKSYCHWTISPTVLVYHATLQSPTVLVYHATLQSIDSFSDWDISLIFVVWLMQFLFSSSVDLNCTVLSRVSSSHNTLCYHGTVIHRDLGDTVWYHNTYQVTKVLHNTSLSGTHYSKTFRIQNVLHTLTNSHWRHCCSRSASVSSALEVFFRECAI